MVMTASAPVRPSPGVGMGSVIARLDALRPLSPREKALIEGLAGRTRSVEAGACLMEEGDPIAVPIYVLAGWGCRQRMLPDGRRQIVSFVLPGEGSGLCRRPRPLAFTSTVALTALVVTDASPMLDEASPVAVGLSDALLRAAALDEHRLISQVVRLGRQTAYERFCSLLLELGERLEEVGLGDRDDFELPVTQEVLADALGLSVVHVNRTLQQLRRNGLIALSAGRVRVLDPQRMREEAAPTDVYLD